MWAARVLGYLDLNHHAASTSLCGTYWANSLAHEVAKSTTNSVYKTSSLWMTLQVNYTMLGWLRPAKVYWNVRDNYPKEFLLCGTVIGVLYGSSVCSSQSNHLTCKAVVFIICDHWRTPSGLAVSQSVKTTLTHTVFHWNLTAPWNPASLGMSSHISANSFQWIPPSESRCMVQGRHSCHNRSIFVSLFGIMYIECIYHKLVIKDTPLLSTHFLLSAHCLLSALSLCGLNLASNQALPLRAQH